MTTNAGAHCASIIATPLTQLHLSTIVWCVIDEYEDAEVALRMRFIEIMMWALFPEQCGNTMRFLCWGSRDLIEVHAASCCTFGRRVPVFIQDPRRLSLWCGAMHRLR